MEPETLTTRGPPSRGHARFTFVFGSQNYNGHMYPGLPGFNPVMVANKGVWPGFTPQQIASGPDETDPLVKIGRALDQQGYFAAADRVKLGRGLKDFLDEKDGSQWWSADGEELAEGGVEELVTSMAKSLKKVGLKTSVKTIVSPHQSRGAEYRVEINGVATEIWSKTLSGIGDSIEHDPWMDSTIQPASELNRQLEAAGSTYRLMLFEPGGNDCMIFLLPSRLCQTIHQLETLNQYTFITP